MPVKVQCSQCGKLLAVPDAARGKAVRCPECNTKIAVPLEDQPPAAPTKSSAVRPAGKTGKSVTRKPTPKSAAPAGGDDDFLSSLDLRHAEDRSLRICAKCGKPVGEEDLECPYCGMDSRTGQLTAVARKKLSRKGPDPSEYWKTVWAEPWQFTLENSSLWLRSLLYAFLTYSAIAGCLFMAFFVCERLPPRFFWLAFAYVLLLVFPGWCWHLLMIIIPRTMSKKSDAGTVHFDLFLNIALGIKYVLWNSVTGWFPLSSLLTPISLCHMAMPVTKKGWLSFLLFPAFFRTLGPTLYTWLVFLTINLVPFASWAGAVLTFTFLLVMPAAEGVKKEREALAVVAPAAVNPGTDAAAGPDDVALFKKHIPVTFLSIGVPSILAVVALVSFCFTSVFSMRVLGQYAYFFHNQIELVTEPPEEEFVRMLPHRGGMLIAMVIFAAISPLFGGIIGGIALRMAKMDLEDMKTGRRDPKGRKLTKRAIAISQAVTTFWVLTFVVLILLYTFEVWPFKPREKPVIIEEKPAAKAKR
jgi:DNA-directed RNA polymerase subunit RPC12/RpoP